MKSNSDKFRYEHPHSLADWFTKMGKKESTIMYIRKWIDKECLVDIHNRFYSAVKKYEIMKFARNEWG